MLFLLGMNIGLRAGDEHYALRCDAVDVPSQLQFKRDSNGIRCLVYQEDSTTKTNDGGISHMHKERKVVWVYPSENSEHCPVRIIDKYISLLPSIKPKMKKYHFYLCSLDKLSPAQWYGKQVVGLNTLRKVISTMCDEAGIPGFRTNHSLRRTSTT